MTNNKKVYAVAEDIDNLRGTVAKVKELQKLKKEKEALENAIKNLENEIKEVMVNEDVYAFTAAGFNVTLTESENNRLDAKALEETYPDIYKQFYINKGMTWRFNVRAVSGNATKKTTTTEVVNAIKTAMAK